MFPGQVYLVSIALCLSGVIHRHEGIELGHITHWACYMNVCTYYVNIIDEHIYMYVYMYVYMHVYKEGCITYH